MIQLLSSKLCLHSFIERKCSLHAAATKDDKADVVKPFSEVSLKRCHQILQIRQEENLKYATISLPETISTNYGFHKVCYQRFTALSTKQRNAAKEHTASCNTVNDGVSSADTSSKPSTRAHSEITKSCDGSQRLKEVCVFCNKKDKRCKGEVQKLLRATNDLKPTIERFILLAGKHHLQYLVVGDIKSMWVYYYLICKLSFLNETKESVSTTNNLTSTWHQQRNAASQAFAELCGFVTNRVVKPKSAVLLTVLRSRYEDLIELSKDVSQTSRLSLQRLSEKLQSHFGSKIRVIKQGNVNRVICFHE